MTEKTIPMNQDEPGGYRSPANRPGTAGSGQDEVGLPPDKCEGRSESASTRLQILKTFLGAVTAAHDLKTIYQLLYDLLPRYLGHLNLTRVSILLYDPESKSLVSDQLIGVHRRGESLVSKAQPLDLSISGKCFARATPLFVEDCSKTDLIPRKYVEELNLKATVAVPIRSGADVIGVLRLDNTDAPQRFSEADIEFLSMIAEQLAIVIENARLFHETRKTNEALLEAESRIRGILSAMVDLVFVFDEEARFQFCHTSSDVLLSPPAEFLGKRHAEVMPASINEMFEKAFEKNRKGESAGYEYPVDLEEGTSWFSVKLSPIFLKDCFSGAVAVVRDITDQKALESQLSRQAFTDTITGLPNRALLMDRLGQCIARIPRSEGYLGAVLFVDLDRFKIINDSLGHHVGDLVLKEFADRMAGLVRPSDTVARLGGDEFVFLIDGVSDELDAVRVAERLKEALADPIRVGDRSIHVTVSIGIALLDGRVRSPENVLRDADAAMYRAKEGGRDQYALFNEDMYLHALKTLETERDLHRALEHNELEVHFQPILSLEKKRIVGFEALVRWNHPERGLVMPGEFIPMAEESGLIVLLDHWVLRKSCLQMLEWQREFPELQSDPVWLSVNYSARHFDRPSAIRELTVLLAETGFNPRNLLLEITESVFIRHPHIIRPLLDQIQGLGVQLSLDDFGTGYSSLGYLHHFSVNLLKIDGSFVRNLTDQPRTEGIVRAILTLAEQLNLTVVAEGIETREQSASLRGLGCTLGQGYLFSRPVPAGDIRALLSQHVSGM